MIVLTPEETLDLDRRTIAAGTPGEVLMERAGAKIVEFLDSRFDMRQQRITVVCGKGNNGGDGRVVARMLRERGIPVSIWPEAEAPTLVIDAVLGIGLRGPASGTALEQIRWINASGAKVVAVDIPSGLGTGEHVRADYTVTFSALKPVHVLPPWFDSCGEVQVAEIGTLPVESKLHLLEAPKLAPRARDSHKGNFGHVLVIAGSPGKTGAAAMSAIAALRSGAGLVTVTAPVSSLYPELMTAELPPPLEGKTLVAIGPGLGTSQETVAMVRDLYATCKLPMVVDADALNALADWPLPAPPAVRILTPHPGEFRRLAPLDDRLESSRAFSAEHGVIMILKGYRTVIAHPNGEAYINPSGSPAMAKGGSGDILTGMLAGFYAQDASMNSVHAAVWLHGRCGELGEKRYTDRCLLATDLLDFLPDAIRSSQ